MCLKVPASSKCHKHTVVPKIEGSWSDWCHRKFNDIRNSTSLNIQPNWTLMTNIVLCTASPKKLKTHIMSNQAPQIVPARIEPPPPNWHVVLCGDCRLTLVAWNGLGRDGWLATLNGPHAADTAAAGTNNTLPNR